MSDPTKEENQVKLRRFLELAGIDTFRELPTQAASKTVIARDFENSIAITINAFLGTCELAFNHDCKLDKVERKRLQAIADEVGTGHEFYGDKFAGMSPDEAENWGKGTSREVNYDSRD
jgi:hypothetical protein